MIALVIGLFLIPLGLPGLWLMVGAALLYSYAKPSISIWTIGALAVFALVAEIIEFGLSGRYALKYGGSRRAGWGAIIGGIVGAFVWTPLPVIGPMIGAFAGALVGAWVAEMTQWDGGPRRDAGRDRRADRTDRGRGMKVGIGLVLAVWVLVALWV